MSKNKNTIRFFLNEEISSDKENIQWVQLIRTGNFGDQFYGKLDIEEETLREFKLNFDRNARRVDLAVDYFHESYGDAAGWFKEVQLRNNDKELWINVEWTKKAQEKILNREIRYISAEFSLDYSDSETGDEYGATLFGAGLTNRPHVKDMQPIFSEINNKKGKNMPKKIDFNDILESVSELSDDEKMQLGEKLGFTSKASEGDEETVKKLAEAEEAKQKAEAELKTLKEGENTQIKALSDKVDALEKESEKNKKEADFAIMLSSGKAVPAQKEAFMAGDLVKFAENAVSGINTEEQGSGEGAEDSGSDAAAKKLSEKAEEIAKEKGISYSEAMKQAVKANSKLREKAAA